jgi:hypothetical protein
MLLVVPSVAGAQATVSHVCDTPTFRDGCEHWYTGSSVTLQWSWSPGGSITGGCQNGTFVAEGRFQRSCSVQWADGGSASNPVWFGIDRTAPAVVGMRPDRPPDYNGWFNHPVGLTFQGTDPVSGIASCSSTVFGGPEGPGVFVNGSCTDVAGHGASGSFAINYDATPPPAPLVAAMPGDGKVALMWTTAADSQAEVLRTSAEEPPAVVYQGAGGAFTDGSVRNERRYRYVVTLIDQAGNRAAGDTNAVPTASKLLLPSEGARLGRRAASPPLLVWEAVRKARYYNVQLFRERKKILSAWPKQPRLQLKREWRYRGKQYHLLPARYCWRVWPGFGKRSAHRYGKQLGRKCFRVTR